MAPKRKVTEEEAASEPKTNAAGKLMVGAILPELGMLTNDEEEMINLSDVVKETGVILFFYPQANTPGCTTQACGMRDNLDAIKGAGYVIFGMSADKPKSQANWRAKHCLGFNLLCDPGLSALKVLGVLKGGKSVSRSHIIIEKGGKVSLVEYGVTPKDSIATVAAHIGKAGADAPKPDAADTTAAPEGKKAKKAKK